MAADSFSKTNIAIIISCLFTIFSGNNYCGKLRKGGKVQKCFRMFPLFRINFRKKSA